MRLRLTPRDTTFFDLFAAQAIHLVTGANLLGEMLGADRSTRKEIGKRIADAEHEADDATPERVRSAPPPGCTGRVSPAGPPATARRPRRARPPS